MLDRVAVAAEQLEVREVHRDLWAIDILRSDVHLVMDDDAWIISALLQAFFAKPTDRLHIGQPASLPCLGFVEPLRVLLHNCPPFPRPS